MKPIKGGVDRVVHVNANVNSRGKAFEKQGRMNQYEDCDLSGGATNVIPGTSMRDLVKARPSQSRNVEPSRPIPRKGQPRAADGKFANGGR